MVCRRTECMDGHIRAKMGGGNEGLADDRNGQCSKDCSTPPIGCSSNGMVVWMLVLGGGVWPATVSEQSIVSRTNNERKGAEFVQMCDLWILCMHSWHLNQQVAAAATEVAQQ
ncbi:unnamed protein product [Ceratitis capitata]|uniref:(Mediterranean fruit fly) hypothetical protein n=1 Tax=Ceratitis capitata TaxID=7213 RepID=A0A811ULY5_CERCA|nr:unnamed protein product [Ceratitis capitata]